MVSPSTLRRKNRQADRWLRQHPVVQFLLLAVVPGGTYAAAELLLHDGELASALVLGAVFGITFAIITLLVRRWRRH